VISAATIRFCSSVVVFGKLRVARWRAALGFERDDALAADGKGNADYGLTAAHEMLRYAQL
jgi:hypothetical protein